MEYSVDYNYKNLWYDHNLYDYHPNKYAASNSNHDNIHLHNGVSNCNKDYYSNNLRHNLHYENYNVHFNCMRRRWMK